MLVPALAVAALGSLAGCGDDGAPAAIEVRSAWARATPASTTTGAVYMTLRAGADDTLIGASVDASVALTATAHRTISSDGQLSMDSAAEVALPAGDDVVFAPGSDHVMLQGLASPLVAGESFTMTLSFEHAPDVDITVDIRDDAP